MDNYKKFLVVIDPTSDEQPALSRAFQLAAKTGASVHAFLSIYDFSYEMTTMLSVQEREAMRETVIDSQRDWLAEVLAKYQTDVNCEIHVVWHNRPFEAVIHHALRCGMDLIIKATRAHDSLKSVIFTPTDWHLLRKAPVPVLLVKEHEWPENGKVIAAVDAGNHEDSHAGLNQVIVKKAKNLASLINAETHLVNSYPGAPLNISVEIPDFDPESYNNAVKKHHESELRKLAEEAAINAECCHVGEGLPEDVIPAYARNIDAELVVMGTVGRTGLSAALIGNTAEHVIDQLNCDVLAIKPEGFECPIKLG
ncbi:universal stress protein UspE [Neiella marina]|uniref:Universal stress protein UspE n=1 Tax=Neiella holothuriorum TaxID=2870530 RepID=A0ABS7EGP4_9GAMM|nr:universal stress protein UspE [Neiella holothuriorum]MBW8191517.1 universal stress protein UspE [Neiella holothuriorum]